MISSPDRAPMFGVLAETLSKFMPERRDVLHLSFALADQGRLERLFAGAGFRNVRVERQVRSDTIESFDEYWEAIETGTGSQPQTYRALAEADRRSVRETVKAKLARFESGGRLSMSIEMLIGSGCA